MVTVGVYGGTARGITMVLSLIIFGIISIAGKLDSFSSLFQIFVIVRQVSSISHFSIAPVVFRGWKTNLVSRVKVSWSISIVRWEPFISVFRAQGSLEIVFVALMFSFVTRVVAISSNILSFTCGYGTIGFSYLRSNLCWLMGML